MSKSHFPIANNIDDARLVWKGSGTVCEADDENIRVVYLKPRRWIDAPDLGYVISYEDKRSDLEVPIEHFHFYGTPNGVFHDTIPIDTRLALGYFRIWPGLSSGLGRHGNFRTSNLAQPNIISTMYRSLLESWIFKSSLEIKRRPCLCRAEAYIIDDDVTSSSLKLRALEIFARIARSG